MEFSSVNVGPAVASIQKSIDKVKTDAYHAARWEENRRRWASEGM